MFSVSCGSTPATFMGNFHRNQLKCVAFTDAASGASDDFGKGVAGIELVYTVELPGGGSQGFDPPASRILAMVVPFFEAIRTFGQYVADNYGK